MSNLTEHRGALSLLFIFGIAFIVFAGLPLAEAVVGLPLKAGPGFVVVAEGGASAIAPPSSKTAFVVAAELGVDYVQAEVRQTRDGALVAYHRDSIHDTSDVTRLYPDRAMGPLEGFTFEELSRLDLGGAFGKRHPDLAHPCFGGSRILSLPGLAGLALTGRRSSGLYLTLPPDSDIAAVMNVLRGSRFLNRGQILVEATSLEQLQILRAELPELYTFLAIPDDAHVDVRHLMIKADELGAKGVSLPSSKAFPWHIRRAKSLGLAPWVRDVESNWQVSMLRFSGAAGVVSKAPEEVLRHIGRPPYMPAEEMLNRMDAQSAVQGI